MEHVDVAVIGSGQGGVPFAVEMASQDRNVVLFERSRFGGSCINWGCTPSKAFLASAHAAGRARAAPGWAYGYGWTWISAVMVACRHHDRFAQSTRTGSGRRGPDRPCERHLRAAGIWAGAEIHGPLTSDRYREHACNTDSGRRAVSHLPGFWDLEALRIAS